MSKDYLPKNVLKFILWAQNLLDCILANFERWQAPDPTPYLQAPLEDLEAKHQITLQANSGKVDVVAKNDAWKVTEKVFRTYIQGFIARNPNVTNADRQEMGLPIRDAVITPIGNPVGQVTATVKYLQTGMLELLLEHVAGTESDSRANYGVKIVYGVFADPEEVSLARLTESRFTRRKKERFAFAKEDTRKIAAFCLRYENAKGKVGEWGPIISAVIP